MEQVTVPENSIMSVEKAIRGFLFHCQYEKNLNSKTISAYKTDLKQFLQFLPDSTDIKNLNKEILKTYLQEIFRFKPKTTKRKIASLKAMLNYLEYENDNYINPFRKIKVRFKEPFTLPSVMTIDEVKKIFQLLYRKRNENPHQNTYSYKAQIRNIAVAELLFSTGIRVSELCNLKFEDVDIKHGTIKVFGKGSKERVIQICQSETLNILKSYYNLYKNQITEESHFFVNRLGLQLSTQSVRILIRNIVRKVGLTKKITPHTFKHTFATLLLEEDVDIKYIQNLLGHSTISTTQIYTHVNSVKQNLMC